MFEFVGVEHILFCSMSDDPCWFHWFCLVYNFWWSTISIYAIIRTNVRYDEIFVTKKFKCPFVKIDSNTKLKAKVKKRRENEDNYISIKALNGKELDIEYINLVLYRHDVLKETKENTTEFEWELISFHAIPKGIKNMPMGPITMMRNQLQLEGGTKGRYTPEEWAESVHFWQNYALKEK